MGRLRGTEDQDSVTVLIVRIISAYTNTEPTELQPLEHSIDTDALEQLIASSENCVVHFEHEGVPLSVYADETVDVRGAPMADSSEAQA